MCYIYTQMIPFGETIQLWRLHRGLTQAQLAQAARIPRPNLSAIERGKREVSLSTLRALAVALDVRPGMLVDGHPPVPPVEPTSLSRQTLERLADAVACGRPLPDAREEQLAGWLRAVIVPPSLGRSHRRRWPVRAGLKAWLNLQASCPADVLRTLMRRIDARYRHHEPETN